MSISPISAAAYICRRSKWSVTQLALQKILYLAHMVHLGRAGEPLVSGNFEAWDYGPVHPTLYQKVKAFGSKPIPDIFGRRKDLPEAAQATLNEACEILLHKSPAELVRDTHWKGGAWAECYMSGVRGIVIPEEAIAREYKRRVGNRAAA